MQALYQLSYNPEDAHKYRMSCCACQGYILKKLNFFQNCFKKRDPRSEAGMTSRKDRLFVY
ncbi:hypothetical protein B7991_07325 [Fibrobacter sp. UWB3]|nr:hypothetical protein B7991_07325 [Fibrobacter sp. UWB3]